MLGRPKKKKDSGGDGPPPVPESMTTFADMVTLMLTFFILLCTFAETQNTEYYASGVGSFRRAVENFGLPGLMETNSTSITMTHQRPEYERSRTPGEEFWEEVDDRLIEESPEVIREAVLESIDSSKEVLLPTGVRFSKRSTRMVDADRVALDRMIESIEGLDLRIEVFAFGDRDQDTALDALSLAVERARAVGHYLVKTAGVPPSSVSYTGLKPRSTDPISKGQGDEVILRLERL